MRTQTFSCRLYSQFLNHILTSHSLHPSNQSINPSIDFKAHLLGNSRPTFHPLPRPHTECWLCHVIFASRPPFPVPQARTEPTPDPCTLHAIPSHHTSGHIARLAFQPETMHPKSTAALVCEAYVHMYSVVALQGTSSRGRCCAVKVHDMGFAQRSTVCAQHAAAALEFVRQCKSVSLQFSSVLGFGNF